MGIEFTDGVVSAEFESAFDQDKVITIQGIYHGKLSNITKEVAEKLIAMEDNQVKRKAVAASNDKKKSNTSEK